MARLLLLILLSLNLVYGQQGEIAQLESAINKNLREPASVHRDSSLLETYLQYQLAVNSDPKALNQAELLLQLSTISTNSKWEKAMGFYNYIRGIDYLQKNQLYLAFDYLEKAILEFKNLNDNYHYSIVNNKFVPLLNWNMIENKIPEERRQRYNRYILDAVAAAENGKDTAVIANLKITHASYQLFVLGDFESTLRSIDQIFELLKHKNKTEWFDYYYLTMVGQGLCYLYLGKTNRGEAIINRVISACSNHPNYNQANYVKSQIAAFVGKYYIKQKDFKKASYYISMAEKNTDFMAFPYFENYLNKTRYEVAKNTNQQELALVYLEKIRDYELKAEAAKLNQSFAEWQIKYETEIQKNKITQLENENLIKSEEKNRAIRNALIFILIIGAAAGILIFRTNRKLKQKNAELVEKNHQISTAMYKGQSLERKRVASELHDNINTKIAALKWRVESWNPKNLPNADQIHKFIEIIDDVYADVRLISHNLLPTDFENLGLVNSIKKLINNLENQHLKFYFITNNFSERVNNELEFQVYNITLELINNILKHADATKAWISLSKDNNKLILSVSDNGKGADFTVISEGVGLKNIKSRVSQLDGILTFNNSEPQKGTSVQIIFPIF